jgi:hypothetical protein
MYTISGKSENNYGHNDRERLGYYFINYDEIGIESIGYEENDDGGRGGMNLKRPYTDLRLADELLDILQADYSLYTLLESRVKKFHQEIFEVITTITEEGFFVSNIEDIESEIFKGILKVYQQKLLKKYGFRYNQLYGELTPNELNILFNEVNKLILENKSSYNDFTKFQSDILFKGEQPFDENGKETREEYYNRRTQHRNAVAYELIEKGSINDKTRGVSKNH